jgi:DNA end-binding protein Ku
VPRKGSRRRGTPSREAPREPEAQPRGDPARPRGLWSGSLTFGLVTIPVELYSATRSRAQPLRMLSAEGVPLAREYICPREEKPLADDEIERGYELDGKLVLVSDEELESLAPRRSRDIELLRFVDRGALDPAYFVRPYLVLPGGEQTKAYRLLAEVMEAKDRAALASFVMRGKAHAVAIVADGGLLRAETLRFADELRDPAEMGLAAPRRTEPARVAEFRRAIEKLKHESLDRRELSDEGRDELVRLAERKRERGEGVVEAPEVSEANAPAAAEPSADGEETSGQVVDLLAALHARLGGSERKPPRAKRRPGSRTRKSPSGGH